MILPLFLIIPLLTVFTIAFIGGKKDTWAVNLSFLATLSLTVLAVISFFDVRGETIVYKMGNWPIPTGICLVLDSFSAAMLILVSFIAFTSILFSVQYIRHIDTEWKYYALFMLLVTGMNGVIITGDLFNLFVFMEIALLAAFALVAFGGKAEEYEAAFKYAVMGGVSSILVLIGIGLTYSATSTLTMAKIGQLVPTLDSSLVYWIGGIFIAGFGLKAAVMPFHAWLPDAHSSAPAPISSMLSGVLIKVLGIYAIVRIFYNVLGAPEVFLTVFLVIGTISIVIAGLLAIGQWDIKRLLAYSSISQIGYILLGFGLATPLGILGAVFHLFNHGIFKSLLFYNAGTVEMVTGTRDLKKLGNLTETLPVTSSTSMIASLAISGIPPFNGFFSKLILIIAAVQAGHPVLAFFAILGSLFTLAALLKVQRYGFRGREKVETGDVKVGFRMKLAMIVLAALCLLSSLLIAPGIRKSTLDPIVSAIAQKSDYIQMVLER